MRWKPVDVLTTGFALLLLAVGLVRFGALEGRGVLLRMGLVAIAPAGIAWLRLRFPNPSKKILILLDFYVIACVLAIFDGLGPLIRAMNPVDRDPALIAFDRRLFGVDPTVWLEPFATPFLSDVLTVFYALYYFHPIVLGALVYNDDRLRRASGGDDRSPATGVSQFPRYAFVMVLVFYVSYVGYFLVPAIGPRYTVQHAGPLPRGVVSAAIDSTLDKLESNKRDCFPSGHTMVVTAVALEALRRSKKTFLWFLPFAAGLVLATVYCRYHYVADVLAGLALVALTVPAGNALYRRFSTIR